MLIFNLAFEQKPDIRGYLKDASSLEFFGKIDTIYRDPSDHNVMIVVLNNKFEYRIERNWEIILR
ncbi:hypothetical protein DYU05_19495 [Mucilaginibacter terrenus]|uniref:Uncharacterized protein n=1 Tax=Mucilaginibacter terrenus TaxID=2482727 RepID=A0A3E2NKF2_9SPHI|nr:hypothetical protein DYU05_19495 [Mucilaginibacter terrenus]